MPTAIYTRIAWTVLKVEAQIVWQAQQQDQVTDNSCCNGKRSTGFVERSCVWRESGGKVGKIEVSIFSTLYKENWGTKKVICQKTPTTDLHLRLGWKDLLKLQSGTYSQGHPLFPCALQRLCRTEQPYAHQNRVPAHWQRQLPNTTAVT